MQIYTSTGGDAADEFSYRIHVHAHEPMQLLD